MTRDAAHYRKMLSENPDTTVEVSRAAAAVYAARYGVCEAEDRDSAAYRQMCRELKQRYGEYLSASDVLAEMDTPGSGPQLTLTTEHAAASYGIPVLIQDDQAYGPSDLLPSGEYPATVVARWSLLPERTEEELEQAQAFLSQAGSLVSRGDIASHAGVTVDAVSQWVRRYPEFPQPAARTTGGDVYWWVQVRGWLKRTGRI